MLKHRQLVEELLAAAGVAIDGKQPWDIQVRDERLYTRVLREQNLGIGESYMEDWRNLGPHYDKTLMAWHQRFQNAWPELKKKFDERFKRMWEYYLLSCAGAFRARHIQLWQIVFTKYGTPQPARRH